MSARTLKYRLVLLAFCLCSLPIAAFAQNATPVIEDGVFRDPDGRFTVPVPTNWTVDRSADFPVLIDPEGDLRIAIVVVSGPDAVGAVDEAWNVVAPNDDRSPQPDVTAIPDQAGLDELVVVTDDFGDLSGDVRQAVAMRVGDQNYVLLASGSLDAAIQRASQTQIILTGFTISSLDATPVASQDLLPFEGALAGEFDAYTADLLGRLDVPGAAVAIVIDGQVVFARGYGVTERGGTQPIGPDTYMMIGSTTKSMTTMMMASAIDDGIFTWDTPAVEIYPSFTMADPDLTSTVSMRNLVCACTGVPRQDLEFALNGDASAEDVVASLATIDVYTDFGEAFQYSNQMVATGGYIAAHADHPGEALTPAYLTSMQDRVFDPVGMRRTTFSFADVAADPNHAQPHGQSLFEGYVPIPIDYEQPLLPIAPAGAAWSTANDMATYLITQMQRGLAPNGTQVVSPENLTETWQPQVQVDAANWYGLGWLIGDLGGQPLISHDGNTFGFSAKVAFLPDSQTGIVVLANAQGSNLFTEGVAARFFELLQGKEPVFDESITNQLDMAELQWGNVLKQIGERPDPADVADLIGRYQSDALGTVDISLDTEGALLVDTGEFVMEARPVLDGPVRTIVIIDPPLALSPIEIREGERGLELVVVEGTDERVFYRNPDLGTPVASPASA